MSAIENRGRGKQAYRVTQAGSWTRLAGETLPTEADGVREEDSLLVIDEANNDTQAYKFYQGQWRVI